MPRSIRKRNLKRLFAVTADAFGVSMPDLRGLSHEECLEEFARFTRDNAVTAMMKEDPQSIRSRLFHNAFALGEELRAKFGIEDLNGVMQAGRAIYRIIGIDFRGDTMGYVSIPKCFFSSSYSPEVCRFISSLDEGIFAGLSGGRRLEFSWRLTDGHTTCWGRLLPGTSGK